MRRRFARFRIAFFAVAAFGSLIAAADTTLEDAKDYRLAIMTAMSGHVGAISMNVRGLVENQGFLAKHADALASGAAELKNLFPPGSNVDDSEALPAIWEQPDEFAEAISRAVQATTNLREAAVKGDQDAIKTAFREVAHACRGCHDRFRMDDD